MPGRRRVKGKKHKKRRIHHKNVEQSLPIRMANFHELQMREYYIDTSEKDRFELDELKEFQIKAVESDFDSPLPFFRRYQGSLPPVNEEDMHRHFPVFEEAPARQPEVEVILNRLRWFTYYLGLYLNFCMVYMLRELEKSFSKAKAIDKHAENAWDGEAYMSDSTPPKPLCEFSSPEWIAGGVEGDDKEHEPFPHLRFGISHDTNGDNRLLRGELLAIMRLMMGRFRPKAFANHCVIPVLGTSYMGPQHARILISYIEGDDLVVGYSKLYDFRTRDDYSLQLFARWSLCSAYGITRENQKVLRSNS